MAETLGRVIKTFREKKGLLQQELAAKIDVSAQSISNIEGDRQYPSKVMLSNIATALDVPSDVIEMLALDLSQIDDPEKREMIGKSYKNLRFLIKEAYDLI